MRVKKVATNPVQFYTGHAQKPPGTIRYPTSPASNDAGLFHFKTLKQIPTANNSGC